MSTQSQRSAATFAAQHQVRERKGLHEILPPEGVPIRLALASMGQRYGAQILDLLFCYGALIAFALLFGYIDVLAGPVAQLFFSCVLLLIRAPYYILFEIVWNGQTPGKRLLRLKVISENGKRLTPYQVAARNVMKEAEVFLPITLLIVISVEAGGLWWLWTAWFIATLAVPLFSRKKRRLGDMIAGTLVVQSPKAQLLPDLSAEATADDEFEFLPDHLIHYGRFELQALEEILRNRLADPAQHHSLEKICSTIARKIGYTERIRPGRKKAFLNAFYTAQRAYLEQRQLFGQRRENKFDPPAGGDATRE